MGLPLQIRGRPAWATSLFCSGVVFFLVATSLVVLLERRLLMVGSISTLGLTPLAYLISMCCLSAALLPVLLSRDRGLARFAGVVAASVVVVAVAVATIVLGTAAYAAASTPLIRIATDGGDSQFLVRLGTVVEPSGLSLYRSDGRWFDLIVAAGLPTPDTERFEYEHRVEESPDGVAVLVYPTSEGRLARVELPK